MAIRVDSAVFAFWLVSLLGNEGTFFIGDNENGRFRRRAAGALSFAIGQQLPLKSHSI
jgi:hypothetical protein